VRARGGQFDAVLTMYHDQGQIAMKLMGFDRGVTLLGGFSFPICTRHRLRHRGSRHCEHRCYARGAAAGGEDGGTLSESTNDVTRTPGGVRR